MDPKYKNLYKKMKERIDTDTDTDSIVPEDAVGKDLHEELQRANPTGFGGGFHETGELPISPPTPNDEELMVDLTRDLPDADILRQQELDSGNLTPHIPAIRVPEHVPLDYKQLEEMQSSVTEFTNTQNTERIENHEDPLHQEKPVPKNPFEAKQQEQELGEEKLTQMDLLRQKMDRTNAPAGASDATSVQSFPHNQTQPDSEEGHTHHGSKIIKGSNSKNEDLASDVRYAAGILERNPIRDSHVPYYSGHKPFPKGGHGLSAEVWAEAWKTAKNIMVVDSDDSARANILYDGPPSGYKGKIESVHGMSQLSELSDNEEAMPSLKCTAEDTEVEKQDTLAALSAQMDSALKIIRPISLLREMTPVRQAEGAVYTALMQARNNIAQYLVMNLLITQIKSVLAADSTVKGFVTNIDTDTVDNTAFRKVVYTAQNSQLVLMSLKPMEDIGTETHPVDQFFRIEQGTGVCTINGTSHDIKAGSAIVVPAGAEHNVENTGKDDLKLYSLYSPPQHKDGTIHQMKADAEKAEEKFDGQTTEG